MPHDYISTENLLVYPNGDVILLDDCALEKEKKISEEYQLPLSPSEVKSLIDPSVQVSRSKSIVWAIGLTTLSIATVTEIKFFYNETGVNFDYVESKLKKINALGYSEAFCELMDACLKFHEAERASIESIVKYLKGKTQMNSKKESKSQAIVASKGNEMGESQNKNQIYESIIIKMDDKEGKPKRNISKGFTLANEDHGEFQVLKAPKGSKVEELQRVFENEDE